MTNNVHTLPIWKKNATALERLDELRAMCVEKPHLFDRMAVIYAEDSPPSDLVVRYICSGCTSLELFGLLEVGRHRVENTLLKND